MQSTIEVISKAHWVIAALVGLMYYALIITILVVAIRKRATLFIWPFAFILTARIARAAFPLVTQRGDMTTHRIFFGVIVEYLVAGLNDLAQLLPFVLILLILMKARKTNNGGEPAGGAYVLPEAGKTSAHP